MIDSAHIHEIDLFNFNRQHSGANRLPAIVAAPETGTQHSFLNTYAGLIMSSPRQCDAQPT